MGSDPYPKIMSNKDGELITVHSVREQDDATRKGFSRAKAREIERDNAPLVAKLTSA